MYKEFLYKQVYHQAAYEMLRGFVVFTVHQATVSKEFMLKLRENWGDQEKSSHILKLYTQVTEDCHTLCPPRIVLEQWSSTFLMPRFVNTIPHVMVIPNHKIIFVATS